MPKRITFKSSSDTAIGIAIGYSNGRVLFFTVDTFLTSVDESAFIDHLINHGYNPSIFGKEDRDASVG